MNAVVVGEGERRAQLVVVDDPEVAAVYASYPETTRVELFALRQLILDTADALDGVGPIEETLRWGQPSYLTSATGSGSIVRIAATPSNPTHDYAMFFHCQTSLVDTFEHLFGEVFTYERRRALTFRVGEALPEDELRECLAIALTYHRSRR